MVDWLMILAQNDDPGAWEHPAGFDEETAACRFSEFARELGRRLDTVLSIVSGGSIQDASFHSEILLPEASLRFSCFGSMVAFSDDAAVSPDVRQCVSQLALESGYVLMPTDVLSGAYTGRSPGVTGIATWWIRYFDYL